MAPGSAAPEPEGGGGGFPAPPPLRPSDGRQAAEAAAALAERLAELAPAESGALGVAVSGGGDSLALLLAARDHAAAAGLRLEAVTVDHGLRPEAAAEAAAVGALCARWGVPHAVLRWQAPGRGNLAAAARAGRAELIAGWAADRGLPAAALGHTLDDQAETLLMRAARGSGLDGLSAMRPAVRRDGLLWLRPALGVRREALRALLRARGQGWFDDPSNEDASRDRIKARRALAALAPLGLSAEGLADTAARLAEDADHLQAEARALGRRLVTLGGAGELRLPRRALLASPPPLRRRLLARLFQRLPGAEHPPRRAALAALEAALAAPGEMAARTLGGVLAQAEGGRLLLCREPAALPPPGDPAEPWDGRWRLRWTGPAPAEPLRAGALGEAGLAALRAAQRAGDWTPPAGWAAAPRAARLSAPALWAGDRLAAAPLAGLGPALAEDRLASDFTE